MSVVRTHILETYAEFELADGSSVKIDLEDLGLVSEHSWHVNAYGYIVAGVWNREKKNNDIIYLHRVVLAAPKGTIVDHINGDRKDCRKANLRFATRKQNGQNRVVSGVANKSGYIGVHKTRSGKWTAQIKVDGKAIHLGNFEALEEAVRVRRDAELELFGEFASVETKREA